MKTTFPKVYAAARHNSTFLQSGRFERPDFLCVPGVSAWNLLASQSEAFFSVYICAICEKYSPKGLCIELSTITVKTKPIQLISL
jgi:hypothetical protein